MERRGGEVAVPFEGALENYVTTPAVKRELTALLFYARFC